MKRSFFAVVRRVDGSSYHAATVMAESLEQAKAAFVPDYGFGTYWFDSLPAHIISPSAEVIQA